MSSSSLADMTAHIINGKRDGSTNEERWSYALGECNSLGLKECKRSPAVFTSDQVYQDTCGVFPDADSGERFARGCMFAHRVAMETVRDGGERAVIFEDDIHVSADKPRAIELINRSLADTEDRDVVYLGHCFDTWCTHAYVWTPSGAAKALDNVDWCSNNPIDVQLGDLCSAGTLTCEYLQDDEVRGWGGAGPLGSQRSAHPTPIITEQELDPNTAGFVRQLAETTRGTFEA